MPTDRWIQLPDRELEEWIQRTDGSAIIGFKDADEAFGFDLSGRAFASKRAVREGKALLRESGLTIDRVFRHRPTVQATGDPSTIVGLRDHPNVDLIVPNYRFRLLGGQDTTWNVRRVGAPEAWEEGGTKGAGVKLLLIDTGLNEHEDLPVAAGDTSCTTDPETDDDYGHGTMMAGIITALDNSVGIIGVAPAVELWLAKTSSTLSTNLGQLTCALDFALDHKPFSINMSFGVDTSLATSELISRFNQLYHEGSYLVAAVGNTTDDKLFPASHDSVVGVGATDSLNQIAEGSAEAEWVELVAPGEEDQIITTCRDGSYGGNSCPIGSSGGGGDSGGGGECDPNDEKCTSQGATTSAATAHVSAAAAVLNAAMPSLTNRDVRRILNETARNLGEPETRQGNGLLDLDAALESLFTVDIQGPTSYSESGEYTWEAFPEGGESSYTYQWHVDWENPELQDQELGTEKTQSLNLSPGLGDFLLSVYSTSGNFDAEDYHRVTDDSGSGDDSCCITPESVGSGEGT